MTDRTELQIDLLERAMLLEQSARRLLNHKGKVAEARADLKSCTDAFTEARVALHAAGMGGHLVEDAPAPVTPEEEPDRPGFEMSE